MKLYKKALIILFTIMISACGGGNDGVPTDSPANEQKLAVWGNFSWNDESAWQ